MSTSPIKLTSFAHGGGCGCKIAPGILSEILKKTGGFAIPPQLLVGMETSDDAAVYQLNDEQALVATTDFFMPIVDDAFDFGRIAATNAISDVYAMGGTPIMALALVGMPINKLPLDTIGEVLRGGASICAEAGIPVAGGHSIDSLEPIYGLVVLGLVHPSKVRRNADARAGDVLILGKGLGVGILSAALKKEQLDADGYRALIDNTTRLNKPGPLLAQMDSVHAMTDVTGFGLLGHLLEMARGSKLRAEISLKQIPFIPQALALAQQGFVTGASGRNFQAYQHDVLLPPQIDGNLLNLLTDPQTAGGLLISCAPDAAQDVIALMRREGFAQVAEIGVLGAGAAQVAVLA
jgi:selenide,water dikinase